MSLIFEKLVKVRVKCISVHMYTVTTYVTAPLPENSQNADGLSYATFKASCVQYSLSCPPIYVMRTKQAKKTNHCLSQ